MGLPRCPPAKRGDSPLNGCWNLNYLWGDMVNSEESLTIERDGTKLSTPQENPTLYIKVHPYLKRPQAADRTRLNQREIKTTSPHKGHVS